MRLAITCGDPAGVGPEVVAGWLRARKPDADVRPCLIGPASWLERFSGLGGIETRAVGPAGFCAEPGVPTEAGAEVARLALEEAAAGCLAGRYDAAVTAPVSKIWMQRVGFRFPGQSEFFAERWRGEPSMAFTGGRLRVVLATWHIPLAAVPAAVTRDVLARAVARADWLARAEGADAARVGVCGLNPHAGEGGVLGREEVERIDPWLDELRGRYPGVSRALPGDTVFGRMLKGDFDAVVALYHDQGLAPVKTLEFDRSVNVTLGLPHIRTSPDHGTGFDIAGRGIADPSSFANAVDVAARLARYLKAHPFD